MIAQTPRILLEAVEAFVAFLVAEFRQRQPRAIPVIMK
jgi:hypothetical protein